MVESGLGDFFISDGDDDLIGEDDDLITPAIVVPASPAVASPASNPPAPAAETPVVTAVPPEAAPAVAPAPAAAPTQPVEPVPPAGPEGVAVASASSAPRPSSREQRLADALNALMEESQEVQAAALVSLDGFTMASALPEGMQEDRVGAMSAAILGLGERAAAELGKGRLSQVFIEGDEGYVLLIAAGDRAVLTCLADADAKLGLVLYDMRGAAETIADILD
jgi:predicted regulator of Ras-like GTPase activity (Roadblock/LC7/MglB family)